MFDFFVSKYFYAFAHCDRLYPEIDLVNFDIILWKCFWHFIGKMKNTVRFLRICIGASENITDFTIEKDFVNVFELWIWQEALNSF